MQCPVPIALKLQVVTLQGYVTSELEEYFSPGWDAAAAHGAGHAAARAGPEAMEPQLQPNPEVEPALQEEPAYEAGAAALPGLARMEFLLQAAFEPQAAVPRAATTDQVGSSHSL